jgi:F-type H+-transporting ATPase subunit a
MSNVAMVIPGGIRHPSGHVAATRAEVGGVSPHPLSGLSSSLGEHTYWCWGKPCHLRGFLGLEVNVDTFAMTILVLAIILALALWVRLHLSEERPRGVQNVLESVFDFVNGFVADNLGSERTRAIGPLAVALFLFILIANYLDLLPIPGFRSPTGDLNTTAGLALMVFILVQFLGTRARGTGGYVKHFFQPFAALAPLEVIMELTKPVTLAFRLFGNIFAGEVLIIVFAALLAGFLPAEAFAHSFAVGLGLFVGVIQAFIFTVLTVAYIGIATSSEEAH